MTLRFTMWNGHMGCYAVAVGVHLVGRFINGPSYRPVFHSKLLFSTSKTMMLIMESRDTIMHFVDSECLSSHPFK